MPGPAAPEINFAQNDELENRPGGKFVRWGLTYGKVVIVITELVVIGLWLSRFYFDNRIAELNEVIRQKTRIIQSSDDFEKKFRAFSLRVSVAKEIVNALPASTVLSETKKLLPEGITTDSLIIDENRVSISGTSTDEEALGFLTNSFKNSDKFTNVDFKKVAKDTTSKATSGNTTTTKAQNQAISFSLTADYVVGGKNGQ